jgi:hypothetical protein
MLATASEQTRGEATMHNNVIRPTTLPVHRLFSRNPLLRPSDRIETAAVTLAALLVVAAAVCAGVLGTLIYGAETQNYHEQAQTRHAVVATAVGDSNGQSRLKQPPSRSTPNGRPTASIMLA